MVINETERLGRKSNRLEELLNDGLLGTKKEKMQDPQRVTRWILLGA